MTPEREAQMRDLFERLFPGNPSPHKASAWDGFLACARALEPKLKDAERYQWLRNEANNTRAWAPMTFNCNPHYQIGWSDALHGGHLDAAIDAAMSAALEDEKNANE